MANLSEVHTASTRLSTRGGHHRRRGVWRRPRTGSSVPSTRPPDGRHARRGRQALPMFLEVSSSAAPPGVWRSAAWSACEAAVSR